MTQEIKVSVVVAAYNAEKYIRQCLDSLLAQTLKEIEVIVVNDGSFDSTWEILCDYQAKDSRVRVFSQENQGAGPARNHGMAKAQGKYLIVLDSDDYFDPSMCETLYHHAETRGAELVIFGAYGLDVESGQMRKMQNLISGYNEMGENIFSAKDAAAHLFQMTYTVAWNKFYLRSFVEEHGLTFQAVRVVDDLYFALMSMAVAVRISFCNRTLVYYRENNLESQIKNITKHPLSFYHATRAAKEGLERAGLYATFRESFLNLAIEEAVNQISRMENVEAFKTVYNTMRDGGFLELGIDEEILPIVWYEKNKEAYEKIMQLTAEEYLFSSVKDFHDAMVEFYIFPKDENIKGARVVIYGAGMVGRSYYAQCLCTGYCDVVLWVDQDYERLSQKGLPVCPPEKILETDYDYIMIAHLWELTAQQIKQMLMAYGIQEESIRYYQPRRI